MPRRANIDAGSVVAPRLACCTTGPSGIIYNAANPPFTNPLDPPFIEAGKYARAGVSFDTAATAPTIPSTVVEASDPITSPGVPPFLETGPVVIMNFDPTEPGIAANPWQPSTNYLIGLNVIANDNIYICVKNGESAATGTGPSGTGANITDFQTAWTFVQPAVVLEPTELNERELERRYPDKTLLPSVTTFYDGPDNLGFE